MRVVSKPSNAKRPLRGAAPERRVISALAASTSAGVRIDGRITYPWVLTWVISARVTGSVGSLETPGWRNSLWSDILTVGRYVIDGFKAMLTEKRVLKYDIDYRNSRLTEMRILKYDINYGNSKLSETRLLKYGIIMGTVS